MINDILFIAENIVYEANKKHDAKIQALMFWQGLLLRTKALVHNKRVWAQTQKEN